MPPSLPLNRRLLASGASGACITEMNCVRRYLSAIKGRSDRMAKDNRLLLIEAELCSTARFAGRCAIRVLRWTQPQSVPLRQPGSGTLQVLN